MTLWLLPLLLREPLQLVSGLRDDDAGGLRGHGHPHRRHQVVRRPSVPPRPDPASVLPPGRRPPSPWQQHVAPRTPPASRAVVAGSLVVAATSARPPTAARVLDQSVRRGLKGRRHGNGSRKRSAIDQSDGELDEVSEETSFKNGPSEKGFLQSNCCCRHLVKNFRKQSYNTYVYITTQLMGATRCT